MLSWGHTTAHALTAFQLWNIPRRLTRMHPGCRVRMSSCVRPSTSAMRRSPSRLSVTSKTHKHQGQKPVRVQAQSPAKLLSLAQVGMHCCWLHVCQGMHQTTC